MIRVMLVDDELPALKLAESVLRTFEDVNICGVFTDPDELLECLNTTIADLILVDMKMPGIHGLELAGRIQEQKSEIAVVFVTAYDDYAVEAFETEALDYIMKPITAERMQKTLDRVRKRFIGQKQEESPAHFVVKCFGRFSLEKEQSGLIKFRTAKTEELMTFLLHYRGNPVSKEKIMEELWYDRDAEKAQSMLYTTLYQLRKDLEGFGLTNVIQHSRKEGGLCRLSWLPDEWDYEEYVEGNRKYKEGKMSIDDAKHLVELHKNGYLAECGYSWAEERKNEIELSCAELLEEIADYEVKQQRFEFALKYLKNWADMFPYIERVHMKIIALYLLMNNKEAAKTYYRNIKNMFEEEVGVIMQVDIEMLALNPKKLFYKKN